MQAVDTNILIYAHVTSSRHHEKALKILRDLAQGAVPWALPWPCVYEFLRVVTHPRVFNPPAPVEIALMDIQSILRSPSLVLLSETFRHPQIMDGLIREAGASGNLIHDAHIATLCLEHGVTELLTGDRDFLRFTSLSVKNPF